MRAVAFQVILRLSMIAPVVAACGHTPPPEPAPCDAPEPLILTLRAADRLNPDDAGQSLATAVRVYQLKKADKLGEATLDDLIEKGKELLGADVLGEEELTLQPGEKQQRTLERPAEMGFIGVVAMFRRPTGNGWRLMHRLPAFDTKHCHPPADGKPRAPLSVQVLLEESRVDAR
jgi:type VI secretion system protein VasD